MPPTLSRSSTAPTFCSPMLILGVSIAAQPLHIWLRIFPCSLRLPSTQAALPLLEALAEVFLAMLDLSVCNRPPPRLLH